MEYGLQLFDHSDIRWTHYILVKMLLEIINAIYHASVRNKSYQ